MPLMDSGPGMLLDGWDLFVFRGQTHPIEFADGLARTIRAAWQPAWSRWTLSHPRSGRFGRCDDPVFDGRPAESLALLRKCLSGAAAPARPFRRPDRGEGSSRTPIGQPLTRGRTRGAHRPRHAATAGRGRSENACARRRRFCVLTTMNRYFPYELFCWRRGATG